MWILGYLTAFVGSIKLDHLIEGVSGRGDV
jgi:hypothetical protein